jgi:hypothetical protein
MLRECFGVPILKSYTAAGARELFASWEIERVQAHGYLWMIVARKVQPVKY